MVEIVTYARANSGLDSPLEHKMLSLLVEAPFLGTRTVFCHAADWKQAEGFLRTQYAAFNRSLFVVFPQLAILRYRVDFFAALAPLGWERGFVGFFLECDGKEFHTDLAGKSADDLARQHDIERFTKSDFLRFSGAEINFAPELVGEVMDAYVEARIAIASGTAPEEAQKLLEAVRREACHPVLRPMLPFERPGQREPSFRKNVEQLRQAQREDESDFAI